MSKQDPRTFSLWAAGDAHVGTDLRVSGRRSLAAALTQSERGGGDGGPAFHWDIMLDIGDLSGSQTPPSDEEGEEVVRQYSALTIHNRADIYNIVGNHDASGPDEETQWWFKKWVDPFGENTVSSGVDSRRRPYPLQGRWDRYKFEVGNIVFLAMGDRNDGGPPVGRGSKGGFPAGAVTMETFKWWCGEVLANQDRIIVSAHHHMLKATTVASLDWVGVDEGYHGRFEAGAPIGASYLYWVGGEPDTGRFERFLKDHPGAVDVWLGGHTHTNPEDTTGKMSHVESKWGTTFINVAAMSKHHGKMNVPMSRLLTFTEGSKNLNIRCYLHTNDFAPQGWYGRAERNASLKVAFTSQT
ncbi:MAG: metallophosphoesterase [Candidatus Latescibacterota bacterium]|nr:metallophosphoesterase [Candidatus Latescibacterota bacterium]